MIAAGVKNIALSHPFKIQSECNELLEAVSSTCDKYKTSYYYEDSMLTSDLFPKNMTDSRYLYIFYQDSEILQTYKEIKNLKADLILRGIYNNENRLDIARRFGTLLGYTDDKITSLILSNNDKE